MAKKPDRITRSSGTGRFVGVGREQDKRKVAAGQSYEVNYFARKHGITRVQARDLIEQIGNDRAKLNEAAEKLKR